MKFSKANLSFIGLLATIGTALSVHGEIITKYTVSTYQCNLTPPHQQTSDIIYQGDNLGICMETLFNDTYIDSVMELRLVQDDGAGGTYETSPISGGVDNVITASTCGLENRDGEPNSKCFIETAMLSKFYNSQKDVHVIGLVDLQFRTTPQGRYELNNEFDINLSVAPAVPPTANPTFAPSHLPSANPTVTLTSSPSTKTTFALTSSPTSPPTNSPTDLPTNTVTSIPTVSPTDSPIDATSSTPTDLPTDSSFAITISEPTASPLAQVQEPTLDSFSVGKNVHELVMAIIGIVVVRSL
mmetsp:Transcript_13174/g.16069  ORF Transcript_13174/g.16069 Transcript_13174/m.16069 type:complete len:299 (+) Transcript_13174:75-971(+)|eukprot:CAMPEP_0194370930 /NCGR_PEP_ID=MMETSP0174-20130528/19272_1 /TAXON_ID=216777 /ORGANISM="Proboscia alata, Strain PI-D3" /LENGTH=298 /DNA_ID=CAMNT_0039148671 /DNA_START=81 /DNA_END=977 /DNA_ORIENTATION=-